MTLLATLFPAYTAQDFDLDIAMEAKKRLVITVDQAIEWAEAEMREGREPSQFEGMQQEWQRTVFDDGVLQGSCTTVQWGTECNEYGHEEEWILFVQDIPFYKPAAK